MFFGPVFRSSEFHFISSYSLVSQKNIFISSYTARNNYFLLYELIQDLPYSLIMPSEAPEISQIRKYYGKLRFSSIEHMLHFPQNPQKHSKSNPNLSLTPTGKDVMIQKKKKAYGAKG